MKWFKHFSDASNDEELALLIDEFGGDGYMFYWRALETIALHMKPDTQQTLLTYSWRIWSQKIGLSQQKLKKICNFITTKFEESSEKVRTKSLLFIKNIENALSIDCPKLLSIKDNYFKDSRKTCKRLESQEVEVEVEEEIPSIVPPREDGGSVGNLSSCKTKNSASPSSTLEDRSVLATPPDRPKQPMQHVDNNVDYLSASFSESYQQVIDLWKSEREKVGLATGLVGKNSKTGAMRLSTAIDSGETTLNDVQTAMSNLLADPEKSEKYTLIGLVNNFEIYLNKSESLKQAEVETPRINTTNAVTFYSGFCSNCNYSTMGVSAGIVLCQRCDTEVELTKEE